MKLYRVFPYRASAADDELGGAFYRPAGGTNRADSPTPGIYRCLYVSDNANASVAEAFGRFDLWDREVIEATPATPLVPGSRFALATYDLPDSEQICDLDDARQLAKLRLHPSQVVTRDRTVTQQWASKIYETHHYAGVGWWSYYDPAWHSIALWDISRLRLLEAPRILRLNDKDVHQTATTIVRRLVP